MESNDEPRIRLVLLDDHDAARNRSVARLGRYPRLQIVGDAAACTEALELAQDLKPDAVLVETHRLDKRGLEAIAMLSSLDDAFRPAIIAYLEILHYADWPAARAAGADDLLLQEMPPETLAGELRHIAERLGRDAREPGSTPAN